MEGRRKGMDIVTRESLFTNSVLAMCDNRIVN